MIEMETCDSPQPGDFFLVSIHSRAAIGIGIGQALTGDWSRFWHAGIVGYNGEAYAAHPGGVTVGSLEEVMADRPLAFSHFQLTFDEQAAVIAAAQSYLGRPYSFLMYLSIALLTFHVRPKWLLEYVKSTGHFICSQYVDQCYLDAGIHLFNDGRFPGDVTPGDLHYVGLIQNVDTGPYLDPDNYVA